MADVLEESGHREWLLRHLRGIFPDVDSTYGIDCVNNAICIIPNRRWAAKAPYEQVRPKTDRTIARLGVCSRKYFQPGRLGEHVIYRFSRRML